MKTLILYFMMTFSFDFKVPVNHIKVEIVDEDLDSHARCNYVTRTMKFNKRHWKTLPFVHKRELVYHELGHCALNLGHVYSQDIMRPRLYATELDGSNWKELIERMRRQHGR